MKILKGDGQFIFVSLLAIFVVAFVVYQSIDIVRLEQENAVMKTRLEIYQTGLANRKSVGISDR